MEKLLKLFHMLLNLFINMLVLIGVGITLLWLIWDITPQQSISQVSYFVSEQWNHITNKSSTEDPLSAPVEQNQNQI